jgi:hypothetical protein
MAGRILNRRKLRAQAEQAAQPQAVVAQTPPAVPPEAKPKRKSAPRKPKEKKPPPRLRARWAIFDGGMKQVAIFDYNQRTAADAALANLLGKKKGLHFLQIVKEPMPEAVPARAGALA